MGGKGFLGRPRRRSCCHNHRRARVLTASSHRRSIRTLKARTTAVLPGRPVFRPCHSFAPCVQLQPPLTAQGTRHISQRVRRRSTFRPCFVAPPPSQESGLDLAKENNINSATVKYTQFLLATASGRGRRTKRTWPAIAFAIREQLYEIAIQSVVSLHYMITPSEDIMSLILFFVAACQSSINSKGGAMAVDLGKLFGPKFSVVRRPEVHDADVEALKEQLREELRLMQEHRRQMGVTCEQMRAGSSSAAPLHPPAPPEDDDANYVDP
ncbi:hypothetical protein PIB30_088844 [Stylosanthes scabra]|uniref:Uncharacterized protein n=1 Tax=Stylosanthes scabra TaxID=79078 RepID=A0ABU6TTD8_9FABA|nr:hypothetical protein [Stylosanthes scabra]